MGQSANPKRTNEFEARAFARTIRVSPQKLNLVAGLIRGKTAATAVNALTFSKRRIAGDVKKLLLSAIANAENNQRLDVDKLVVSEAYVGKAFVMKRSHARGRGKSAGIHKFFSNMTIILREAGAVSSLDSKKVVAAKAEQSDKTETAKPAKKSTAKAPAAKATTKKPAAKKAAKTTEETA
jgi:large subunit ribosomal protein L22